jgi:FAD dependent oxidoreductase
MDNKVVVMGAGIQGICCALALSKQGISVQLIDKSPEPLLRSGLRNEGKIHLGFIYANDKSFKTASLMLRSALNFSPLVEKFIGRKIDWSPLRSRKFNYLILNSTMLSESEITSHYNCLQEAYERTMEPEMHYLGTRPYELWTDTKLHVPQLNNDVVQRCIPTAEYAINLDLFRELLLEEVAKRDNITFKGSYCIEEIVKKSWGYQVKGTIAGKQAWKIDAETVVNCLWENRLYFDNMLGHAPARKWVYRLKHRILGIPTPQIQALDSFTCVLGAFGDLVNYDNHHTYLSWYPECMTGWSSDITTPQEWEAACDGKIPDTANKEWVAKALAGLDNIIPGLKQFDVKSLDAGIIFSWGKTDIDDLDSELHKRFDIGIHASDGYYSIDTGKFTSAPYFANSLQNLFV